MPSPPESALALDRLTVRFGPKTAVDRLDLIVPTGGITALLGPNGAGKSTTLDVCEGLRRPDSGRAFVLGRDPWRADARHRALIGVMLQNAGQASGLSAVEALRAAAGLYAVPRPADDLIERLRLAELGRTPFRRLSGGEQQRVGLAVALVGRPRLLLLDEPTAGMDPALRRDAWALLHEEASTGTTVVVTTHLIDEAAQHADLVALIARGRCVAADTPAMLAPPHDTVTFLGPAGASLERLTAIGATAHEVEPGRYRVVSTTGSALDRVVEWSRDLPEPITDLRVSPRTLEDAVLELVDWNGPR